MDKKLQIVLKSIVEEYIENATPVSSHVLVEKYQLPFSSSSIRNYMTKLEEEGMIEKHHFASGRVPTSKGYRFYVFNLMNDEDKEGSTQKQLDTIFKNRTLTIDEVIEKSCEIISDLTNLAAVRVDETNLSGSKLKRIEFIPLSPTSAVSIIVLSNGTVQNKVIQIPKNLKITDIQTCINYINERMQNQSVKDISQNLNFIEKLIIKSVKSQEKTLEEIIRKLLMSKAETNPHVYGISNIVSSPDFQNVEKIQSIIKIIEENSIWDHIKQTMDQEVEHERNYRLLLGNEVTPEFDELALISTPYDLGSYNKGQITVIGPKRMNYSKVTSLLKWLSKKIEELSKENIENEERK